MLIDDLKIYPVFGDLDEIEMKKLFQFSSLKRFNANTVIFNQGDRQAGLFFILKGKVELFTTEADQKKILETLNAGDFIGEQTLFGDVGQRPMSARAVEQVLALWINTLDFRRLQNSGPAILAKLLLRLIIEMSNDFRKRNGDFAKQKKELEELEKTA